MRFLKNCFWALVLLAPHMMITAYPGEATTNETNVLTTDDTDVLTTNETDALTTTNNETLAPTTTLVVFTNETDIEAEESETEYFVLSASPNGLPLCVRPFGDIEEGSQLELTACSNSNAPPNTQKWRIDSNGMIHTAVNDNFCWQASRDGSTPKVGQPVRLFSCSTAGPTIQKFIYDGINLQPQANTGLCVTWRGQEADIGCGSTCDWIKQSSFMSVLRAIPVLGSLIPQGADPIIFKSCSQAALDTYWKFS